MSRLLGKYHIKLEETGRLRLPGDMADAFGDFLYIYLGDGPFVRLYPREERDRIIDALENLPDMPDEQQEWQLRELGGALMEVPIKGKGRLTLPRVCREHIGLEGAEELVLIGCVRYAELWKSEDSYQAERKRHREQRLIRG